MLLAMNSNINSQGVPGQKVHNPCSKSDCLQLNRAARLASPTPLFGRREKMSQGGLLQSGVLHVGY